MVPASKQVTAWRGQSGKRVGVATVENSVRSPQKNSTTVRPRNSSSGVYPKEVETPVQKNIGTFISMETLFTIAKKKKETKCPSIDE